MHGLRCTSCSFCIDHPAPTGLCVRRGQASGGPAPHAGGPPEEAAAPVREAVPPPCSLRPGCPLLDGTETSVRACCWVWCPRRAHHGAGLGGGAAGRTQTFQRPPGRPLHRGGRWAPRPHTCTRERAAPARRPRTRSTLSVCVLVTLDSGAYWCRLVTPRIWEVRGVRPGKLCAPLLGRDSAKPTGPPQRERRRQTPFRT